MGRRLASRRGTDYEKLFSWLVLLLFLLASSLKSLIPIFKGEFLHIDYRSWEISEWLINYEGGFVRRGICGELLWHLEQWAPFDVRVLLTGLCIIASCIMLWVMVRLFKKEGWALLIIPTGFCLGYTLFSLFGRRDYISLLVTFAIFLIFKQVISSRGRPPGWLAFYIVSALQLLMHEAAFFYTFPILMLYFYCHARHRQLSPVKSAVRTLAQFLPVMAVMALVCLFKGDAHVAQAIWDSWIPIVDHYQPGLDDMGYGMVAMTWDVKWAFAGHLSSAYIGDVNPQFWRIALVLLNLLAVYYLTTRLDCVNMGPYPSRSMNNVLMSNVVLVQLVAMTPMFTVLSCDWGRTLPYCAISSMFFYHTFKNGPVAFMPWLSSLSSRLQSFISRNRVLRSPYTYILLVALAPVPNYKAPLDHINTFQQKFFYMLSDLFNQLASYLS